MFLREVTRTSSAFDSQVKISEAANAEADALKASKASYKLYYFKLYVRGEPIRMALEQAGVNWEDVQIGFGDWKALKPTMPGEQVPCLELEDGTKMGESMDILRYIGKKHGLFPTDPMEANCANEAMDSYNDVIGKIYKPHMTKDPVEKRAQIKEIFEVIMPNFLTAYDAQFAKGQFISGSTINIADFCVGGLYTNFVANEAITFGKKQFAALLVQFPNFKAYGERFAAGCKRVNNRPSYFV